MNGGQARGASALLAVALMTAACGGNPAVSTGPLASGSGMASPGGSSGGSLGTTDVAPPSSTDGLQDSGFGPGDVVLADTAVGLDGLDAYRAALTIEFDGTQDGVVGRWSESRTLVHSRAPSLTAATFATDGDHPPAAPAFEADRDGSTFTVESDGTCSVAPADPAAPLRTRREPARMLSGLIGATAEGTETVAGIEAGRSTFDERALGLAGIATGEGTAWVGTGGGPVVRYVLRLSGDAAFLGDGTSGTMSWTYELHDVNVPVTDPLPGACPGGSLDVPAMPGAVDVLRGPGALAFTTSVGLAEVVAFYGEVAATDRWTAADKPLIAGDSVLFEFTASGRATTMLAVRRDGLTEVRFAVDPGP